MNAAEREAPPKKKKNDIAYLQVRSEKKYLEGGRGHTVVIFKKQINFSFSFFPLSHPLSLSSSLSRSHSLSLFLSLFSGVSAQLFYIETSLNVDCWACVNIGRKLFL